MKNLKDIIIERLHITKNTGKDTGKPEYNYHPTQWMELINLINKLIKERGNNADLNDIDISKLNSISYALSDTEFNGDISKWDVSNIKYMDHLFANSHFNGENGDISNWDVSNVKSMKDIFKNCPLEKNPPKWYKE